MISTFTDDRANRLQTANAGGAVTTFQHDAAGNRTAVLSPTSTTRYTWDAAGTLTSAAVAAGIVTLTYNADGQRTGKRAPGGSNVGFLYDEKRLLHETNGPGGPVTKTYASTIGETFGDLLEENGQAVHQYDAQACTNALLDAAGIVGARYKYAAFGAMTSYRIGSGAWQSGTVDFSTLPSQLVTHMLAGGQKQYYFDPEINLLLLGGGTDGRYYDPATARYLDEGPERDRVNDPNLYRYGQNDPVNRLNPGGREDVNGG